MKYNELNLKAFVPHGIPLNESNNVVQRRAINAYNLKAFEDWFKGVQDFIRSFQAPYSIEACTACSNEELQRFIEEAGASYYLVNHDISAEFVKDLYTTPVGSIAIINSLVKYVCNNSDVTGSILQTEEPHVYDVSVSGDIIGSDFSTSVVNRLIENLNNLVPVSEKWRGFIFTEKDTIPAYAGGTTISSIEARNDVSEYRTAWFNASHTDMTLPKGASLFIFTIDNEYDYCIPATSTTANTWLTLVEAYTASGQKVELTSSEYQLRIYSLSAKRITFAYRGPNSSIQLSRITYKVNFQ